MIDKERLEYLKKVKYDTPWYLKTFLKIRDKQSRLIPFVINESQQRLYDIIQENEKKGKSHKYIILKARQLGFSTFIEGIIFHRTSTRSFVNSLIIAHEDAATQNLFNMSKLFYDELDPDIKPMKKYSNEKALSFENPTNDEEEKRENPGLRSKITVATAGTKDTGRSGTIHNLHVSEAAFFPNALNTMTALLQCIPDEGSMVFIESTANGVGGYFYDLWNQAIEGKNDFTPVFFPWFADKTYSRSFSSAAEKESFIAEINRVVVDEKGKKHYTDEFTLLKRHRLTYEQLNWRRYTLANKCNNDIQMFKQEYPSTPEEAFISSGRPKFNIPALEAYMANIKVPKQGDLTASKDDVELDLNQFGLVKVFQMPAADRTYTVGADVAEGLKHGDYSVGVVMDDQFNIAAKWRGHIDPDLFGAELVKLARYYNNAYLAIEANNHGLTTIKAVLKQDYYNLFYTKVHDKITDEITKKVGWYTNVRTKPLAIDRLAEFIREKYLGLWDEDIIMELFTYVIDDKGRTNAQQGRHDDCVMALAICLQAALEGMGEDFMPEQPREYGRTKKEDRFVPRIIDPLFESDEDTRFEICV